jgi:hypothetical protein
VFGLTPASDVFTPVCASAILSTGAARPVSLARAVNLVGKSAALAPSRQRRDSWFIGLSVFVSLEAAC